MGNPKGDSIQIARSYLDSLVVEGRIVGAAHPDTKTTLLGQEVSTPIMTAALSHLKRGMAGFAKGAKDAGTLCQIGMGDNQQLGEALATGARVIKIIKPYADPEEIFSRLRFAEENGAVAVGMDVEHAVNVEDDADSMVAGYQMKLPTLEELKSYVKATKLPFLIKGALSVQDAVRAREIGCAGVILGHHNGLLRWAVPNVSLLKDIRRAVGQDFVLIIDGGIADGFDAFKALALGADAVSVGRALMQPYDEKGAAGVTEGLNAMTNQLKAMMLRTGSFDVRHIDPSVIHEAPWLR
ncbi:MAG: alpha-hydroxy-acid oxidizing protein [Clostridia bacterium]|nr:alpha-hydroxy-acid oxidizing protein [Clostridia bacterium]